MRLHAIKKDDLPGFVNSLVKDCEVVGPAAREFKFAYRKIDSFDELALDYNTTLLPPKKYAMPQRETLFSYTLGSGPVLEASFETTRRVIFGVHSCDIHGIALLDDIFAEGRPDLHYLTRRENTFIVGIDCKEPCWEHSFCKSMGTLKPHGGFDLFLTDLGELYAVEATERGKALMEAGRFFQADYYVTDRFYALWREKMERFPDRILCDTGKLPQILAEAYDDVIWDALEERCFDCGACTVVCPTCYCFDVLDEADLDMKTGVRFRKWDSCQLQDFAAVAGGGNFRGKRSDRLRHRLFRKGKYFKEKFGRFACVGCGRCGQACLVHIDVKDIFNQLSG
jgi:sulfhydrogenase subunit beta (sulfur reductase)